MAPTSLRSGAVRAPIPADPVTGRASRLAVDGLPAPRIADLEGRRGDVEAGTDEGDERVEFGRLQSERRHAGGGNARRDGVADVVIGRSAAELLTGKIHPRDAIAILAMAQRALRRVKARAGLDIRGAVLVILDLRDGALRSCGKHREPPDKQRRRDPGENR